MRKKIIFFAALAAVLATGIWFLTRPKVADADMEIFAKCLADKKATMYGAAWCVHCQNQKKLFGEAFRFVPYVECPENAELCTAKGVDGYPTWLLDNGTKLIGEQDLKQLGAAAGCAVPAEK